MKNSITGGGDSIPNLHSAPRNLHSKIKHTYVYNRNTGELDEWEPKTRLEKFLLRAAVIVACVLFVALAVGLILWSINIEINCSLPGRDC